MPWRGRQNGIDTGIPPRLRHIRPWLTCQDQKMEQFRERVIEYLPRAMSPVAPLIWRIGGPMLAYPNLNASHAVRYRITRIATRAHVPSLGTLMCSSYLFGYVWLLFGLCLGYVWCILSCIHYDHCLAHCTYPVNSCVVTDIHCITLYMHTSCYRVFQ